MNVHSRRAAWPLLAALLMLAAAGRAQEFIHLEFIGPLVSPIPPECSTWHELYPAYCTDHHQDGFEDNGDGELSPCDLIVLDGERLHIVWVGPTFYLVDPTGVESIWEPVGDYPGPVNPTCQDWLQTLPDYGFVAHVDGWDDNGDGVLGVCDYVVIAGRAWHIERIEVNIRTTPITTPMPDPQRSSAHTLIPDVTGVSMFTRPYGDGARFDTDAQLMGGMTTNATIFVELLNAGGLPVAGYPAVDIWLQTSMGGLVTCPQGAIADHDTDLLGRTEFTRPVAGGGWSQYPVELCEVWTPVGKLDGTFPGGEPNSNLRIFFNSPDINGDLFVNLTDVVLFANDYFGVYHYRSDFYWDGVINLSDVVLMSQSTGSHCPP
jgi:hypothetical protein